MARGEDAEVRERRWRTLLKSAWNRQTVTLYLLRFLCNRFQPGLDLFESGLQLTSHLTLCANLRNLQGQPNEKEKRTNVEQSQSTGHPPGLHRGAGRESEEANRR